VIFLIFNLSWISLIVLIDLYLLKGEEYMKVIIVGGVAIGPKVAARLRRINPEAEITILEKGSLISYGGCGLPMYLANYVPQLEDLMMTSYGVMRDAEFF